MITLKQTYEAYLLIILSVHLNYTIEAISL